MSGEQDTHDHPLDPEGVARARAGAPGDRAPAGMAAQLSLIADVTRLRDPARAAHGRGAVCR